MKIAHQNRNRDVLLEVQQALAPKQEVRRTRIIDHTLEVQNSEEHKRLASYGNQASTFTGMCDGCLCARYCSACVMTGWIITPRQCKEARALVSKTLLEKALKNVEFKVGG